VVTGAHALVICGLAALPERQPTEQEQFVSVSLRHYFDPTSGVGPLEDAEWDMTSGVPEHCPVHEVRMETVFIPVWYGTPVDNFESGPSFDVRQKYFPHAKQSFWGGCCVGGLNRVKVRQCRACLADEKSWEDRAHAR
jgi:hypothetical protein